MTLVIQREDPRAVDVVSLLERHLRFARATSPSCHVHALDIKGLLNASMTFFTARRGEVLLGVGALKQHDSQLAEIKSMHTAKRARGQGIGRAMVRHLLTVACSRGMTRVSLETGTQPGFASARALYESMGFRPCKPFAHYTANPFSLCMTLPLSTSDECS